MPTARSAHSDELLLASRALGSGLRQNELSVPAIHCGSCVARIERVLGGLPEVERARVNLSTRRVTIVWRGDAPPPLVATLHDAGFDAHLHDFAVEGKDGVLRELVRALAVAGFAAGNIMMLSVAVWSGADPGTRDVFHWLSAAARDQDQRAENKSHLVGSRNCFTGAARRHRAVGVVVDARG